MKDLCMGLYSSDRPICNIHAFSLIHNACERYVLRHLSTAVVLPVMKILWFQMYEVAKCTLLTRCKSMIYANIVGF